MNCHYCEESVCNKLHEECYICSTKACGPCSLNLGGTSFTTCQWLCEECFLIMLGHSFKESSSDDGSLCYISESE